MPNNYLQKKKNNQTHNKITDKITEMMLPVGNTCIVVWDGPLVGTPVCCRGFGCKGGRGRDKGWAGMLCAVGGV